MNCSDNIRDNSSYITKKWFGGTIMLVSYKFRNFTSFREEVEFSLLAAKSKVKNRFPNNFITTSMGESILKTSVIVGENAGGKSNFVRSLKYLQFILEDPQNARTIQALVNQNNIQDKCHKNNNTHQIFEIEFMVVGEKFYRYCLEIDSWGVCGEKLEISKKQGGKYKLLIKLEREELSSTCVENREGECNDTECDMESSHKYSLFVNDFDVEIEKQLKMIVKGENNSGIFINKLAVLGYEHAMIALDWMKNHLQPVSKEVGTNFYNTIKNEEKNLAIMKDSRFFEIFKMVDYSICDIEVDDENPLTDTVIVRRNSTGNVLRRKISMDSSGVREFLAWSITIFKVVFEGKTAIVDEMDRVLNPILSDRVIAYINGTKHRGQFVFTTHNIFHLDLKKFMKEQIYFITKDSSSLESEMYSLSDFPDIRYETTKIYEFYMKGILGGTAIE